jgi:Xylose isomerase-like TIM barrel
MLLKNNIHLGYCTNIHRGETWEETWQRLDLHTMEVRRRILPMDKAYGIGLRLGAQAAQDLAASPQQLSAFKDWLEKNNSYVFTINGFPYGSFHGTRVKEQVFAPDWSTTERLVYTNQLFDLLDEIAPAGMEASVSTLPGSFKEFIQPETSAAQLDAIRRHLHSCAEHIERIREKSGRDLHLGLEPEPLGLFENSGETVDFFGSLVSGTSADERERILRNLGVNYDTCHLAVEFEEPVAAIGAMRAAGIRISKIHLSSALTLRPTGTAIARLRQFQEGVYFHQVLVASGGKVVRRFKDLPDALAWNESSPGEAGEEWRVHFHVPLHTSPEEGFGDTRGHLSDLLALYAADPGWCRHFEFETYTWEVLPQALRALDVVDQLTAEYGWCLGEFDRFGLR